MSSSAVISVTEWKGQPQGRTPGFNSGTPWFIGCSFICHSISTEFKQGSVQALWGQERTRRRSHPHGWAIYWARKEGGQDLAGSDENCKGSRAEGWGARAVVQSGWCGRATEAGRRLVHEQVTHTHANTHTHTHRCRESRGVECAGAERVRMAQRRERGGRRETVGDEIGQKSLGFIFTALSIRGRVLSRGRRSPVQTLITTL